MVDVGVLDVPLNREHEEDSGSPPLSSPMSQLPLISPREGGPDVGVVYTWGEFYSGPAGGTYIEGVHRVSGLCANFGAAAAVSSDGSVFHACPHERRLRELGDCDVPTLSMSSGDGFFAAVGNDNRLYTWGLGDQGQLGLGHTRGSVVPECVASKNRFVQVSCGKEHAAALDDRGDVFTFGRGFEGQTGQGISREIDLVKFPHMAVQLSPRCVKALSGWCVEQIACGHRFTAAVTSDGSVWTWGEGSMGQLGTGRCSKRSVPLPAAGPAAVDASTSRSPETDASSQYSGPRFTDVACGAAHMLARSRSSDVFSWGFNNFGQLGHGDRRTRYYAAKIESHLARTITAGGNCSGMVTDAGELWTWGYCSTREHDDRLGYDTAECVLAPRIVNVLEGIRTSYAVLGGKQLLAFAPSTVAELAPANGPVEGGTRLVIKGTGFWSSESILVKFTPLALESKGDGDGSQGSGKEEDDDDASYDDEASFGNESGDDDDEEEEEEEEESEDEDDDDDPRIIQVVKGTYSPDSRCIECVCPPMAAEGGVSVEVACDGVTFTQNGAEFSYFCSPVVESVEPKCAPLGETVSVVLKGHNFEEHVAFWYVRFQEMGGSQRSTVCHASVLPSSKEGSDQREIDVVVDTSRFSGDECVVLAVDVSANGQDYTDYGQRIVLPSVSMAAFEPASVPCTDEGASFLVRCSGMKDAKAHGLRPQVTLFNPQDGKDVTKISSSITEQGDLECTIGKFSSIKALIGSSSGSVSLGAKVSINKGLHWTRSETNFLSYCGSVASIEPSCGPWEGDASLKLTADSDPSWFFESDDLVVRLSANGNHVDVPASYVPDSGCICCALPHGDDVFAKIGPTAGCSEDPSVSAPASESESESATPLPDPALSSSQPGESAGEEEEEEEEPEAPPAKLDASVSYSANGCHFQGAFPYSLYRAPAFEAPTPAAAKAKSGNECKLESITIPWTGGWHTEDMAVKFSWDAEADAADEADNQAHIVVAASYNEDEQCICCEAPGITKPSSGVVTIDVSVALDGTHFVAAGGTIAYTFK